MLYRIFNGEHWLEFENRKQLINWLSMFNEGSYNKFMESTGIATRKYTREEGIAISHSIDRVYGEPGLFMWQVRSTPEIFWELKKWGYKPELCYEDLSPTLIGLIIRPYRIINEDGNNACDILLHKEVLKTEFNQGIQKQWLDYMLKLLRRNGVKTNRGFPYWYKKKYIADYSYEFRREPVRHTGRRSWDCHHSAKGLFQEMRIINGPEQKPYNRAKRHRNLCTCCKLNSRYRNNNWKNQGKRRKQWDKK